MMRRFSSSTFTVLGSSLSRPRSSARSSWPISDSMAVASNETASASVPAEGGCSPGVVTTATCGLSPGAIRVCTNHDTPSATARNAAAASAHCGTLHSAGRGARAERGFGSSWTTVRGGFTLVVPAVPIRDAIPAQRSVGASGSTSVAARVFTRSSAASVSRHSAQATRWRSSASPSPRGRSWSRYSDSRSVNRSFMTSLHSRAQVPAQQHARAGQLGLRRTGGDAEQPRDLLVAIALDVVQHEDHPRAVRQLRDGLLEIHVVVAPRGPGLDALQYLVVADEPVALDRERGALAQDEVHGQAVEPGGEARLAAERVQLLPRAHEHVLGELGRLLVAHHAPRERVDAVDVLLVQAAKGLRVTTRGQRRVTGLKALGQGALVQGQGRVPGQGCGHCPGLDRWRAPKVGSDGGTRASGESRARPAYRPARWAVAGPAGCNPERPGAVYRSMTNRPGDARGPPLPPPQGGDP